jgi:hypothetical protein
MSKSPVVEFTFAVLVINACAPASDADDTADSGIVTAASQDPGDAEGQGSDEAAADTGTGSSSGGNVTGVVTAFETLTTHPTTNDSDDPTNTSNDTNETGTSEVELLPENVIDDLEDGDTVIHESGGRIGLWYAYDDASGGTQNPAAMADFHPTQGGPNGSAWSATLVGQGFTDWGAGMGFDINNSGGQIKHVFDASAFTGIAFQARGNVAIKFKVQTAAIVPTAEGGTCTAGAACNDAFFATVELTPTWQQHVIPFASLAQGHWGQAAAWDPATIVGLQFEVGAGQSFEVAIDDVGLIP